MGSCNHAKHYRVSFGNYNNWSYNYFIVVFAVWFRMDYSECNQYIQNHIFAKNRAIKKVKESIWMALRWQEKLILQMLSSDMFYNARKKSTPWREGLEGRVSVMVHPDALLEGIAEATHREAEVVGQATTFSLLSRWRFLTMSSFGTVSPFSNSLRAWDWRWANRRENEDSDIRGALCSPFLFVHYILGMGLRRHTSNTGSALSDGNNW